MDATSFWFVSIIILVGGFLAYVADSLGRKLGKKRLSMFGLRPRYTATVLTVAAGIVIPFLTILTLFALSGDVREWLIRGQRAIQENKKLIRDNDSLQRQIDDNTKILGSTRSDLKRAQVDRDKLGKDNRSLEAKNKDLNKRIETAQQRVRAAQELVRTKEAAVSRIEAQRRLAQEGFAKAQSELVSAQQGLKGLRKSYDTLRNEFSDLNKSRDDLVRQLDTLQGQIKTQQDEVNRLTGERDRQKSLLDQANKDLAQATKDLADIREQKQRADIDLNKARQLIGPKVREPLIFKFDEEIVRMSFDRNLTPGEARVQAEKVLAMARQAGIERGTDAEAEVKVIRFPGFDRPLDLTRDEQVQAIVAITAGLPADGVIILSAPRNTFRTEELELGVYIAPNPLIYRAGQTIAETRIDGRLSFDAIYSQLSRFISDAVFQRAILDRMIPRNGQEPSLGQVGSQQLIDVVTKIQQAGGFTRVRANAKLDTRAADFLQLDFKVGR